MNTYKASKEEAEKLFTQARAQTVLYYLDSLKKQREEDLFASHVTQEDKDAYFLKRLNMIEDIKTGKLDHNFTVWQRMNYYITGKFVPFLP